MDFPENAVEEVYTRWKGGAKQSAFYKVGGEPVGYRWWNESGILTMEYGLKGNQRHGPYRDWHDNGVLCAESFFIEGNEHGCSKQYDCDGNLVGTYEMHYGTGADLWYGGPGVLAEERYYLDGLRHGFERWWSWDNATIWEERHYHVGVEHGIAREWNAMRGRLRRGFPKYFVNGLRVTKRQYVRASDRDESLPKYREEDNHPARVLPVELMASSPDAPQHGL